MRKKITLSVLLIVYSCLIVLSQENKVEDFFNNYEYQKVIDTLTRKQAEQELSFQEYYFLSRSYGRTKQYGNGYVLANELIKKARKAKDTSNIFVGYQLKIEHVTDLNKIKEGVQLCDSVMTAYREQDSITMMKTCFPCGMIYKIDNQIEKAYTTYKKITRPSYKKLTLYTNNLATILLKLEKYEEALELFKQGLQQEKLKYGKNSPYINIKYHNLGVTYLNLRNFKLSKIYLDSAYNSLTPKSDLFNKVYIFDSYFLLYKLTGRKNIASAYLDSIANTNEEILRKQVKERIVSITSATKNEKFLKKKVRYIDNELENTKRIVLQSTIVFVCIILLLIITFFFFRYRNIQTTYKNLLIDRTLSWIKLKPSYINNSMESMQEMIANDDPNSIKYLSKFSKFLRLLLENSRKSIVPISDEITTIKHFLEIHQIENNHQFNFTITTDEPITYEEINIPPMLIQPFVEIAIENCTNISTLKPEITIHFSFTNSVLTCIVTDCGTQLEQSKFQQKIIGKKMKELFHAFSKKLNTPSKITFKNTSYKGTIKNSTILILPYTIENYD
ncbi:histidine kinase [uncultured Tenacibaculum sp.]|uniref:histidine kinase n=1 Tax=uncultured Tenacibaculum sp. TaxID=174713 RepID=UPI00261872A0|nr:histidine kinase [uncultured Tenacibaculum sp.]